MPDVADDDYHQVHPEGHENHDLDAPELEVRAEHDHGVQEPKLVLDGEEVVDGDAGGAPVRPDQVRPEGADEREFVADVYTKAPLAPRESDDVVGPDRADEDEDRDVYEQQALEGLDDVQADLLPQIRLQHLGNHLPEAIQGPSLIHVRQREVRLEVFQHQRLFLLVTPAEAGRRGGIVPSHVRPHDGHVLRCEDGVHHGQEQHLDGHVPGQRDHGGACREHVAPEDLDGAMRDDLQHNAEEREDVHHCESHEGVDGECHQPMRNRVELVRGHDPPPLAV
mmetsp:Transcript_34739/g.70219  ORF Transcript_34739/g.70219 Transcript_34739/m.70219 type:complete len:280 (+) Transcript_34739:428-1267(+)